MQSLRTPPRLSWPGVFYERRGHAQFPGKRCRFDGTQNTLLRLGRADERDGAPPVARWIEPRVEGGAPVMHVEFQFQEQEVELQPDPDLELA
jgi:hypothetical protein